MTKRRDSPERKAYMHALNKRKYADNPGYFRQKASEYYARNREAQDAIKAVRRKTLKDEIYDHYGRVCKCCGETEPAFLTIDHVNNDGNIDRANGAAGAALYYRIRRLGFPDSYQVLCMNCNFAKRLGTCPHQLHKE